MSESLKEDISMVNTDIHKQKIAWPNMNETGLRKGKD